MSVLQPEFPSFYSSYNKRDLDNLSKNLNGAKNRIAFESWLLNNFVPKEAADTDFAWHTKILGLLCEKNSIDPTASDQDKVREDHLISKLISIAEPPIKETKGKALSQIARTMHHIAGMKLNFSQIARNIHTADLPSTCTVLLRRLLDYHPVNEIIEDALEDRNFSMLKALATQQPEKFENFLLDQRKDTKQTFVQQIVKWGDEELLQFIAQLAPAAIQHAVTLQDVTGSTPIADAVWRNDLDILHILAKAAPKGVKKAITMQDENKGTPLHYAVVKGKAEILKFLMELAPEAGFSLSTGDTPLTFLKKWRPAGFKTMTNLFKNNLDLIDFVRVRTARVLLAHAWHLSGQSEFIKKNREKPEATVQLTGHQAPEWFHQMSKHLNKFKERYPTLFSEEQIALLEQLF